MRSGMSGGLNGELSSEGQFKVPDDFDTMGQAEIAKLFGTDK